MLGAMVKTVHRRQRSVRAQKSLARPPIAIASLAAIATSLFEEIDVGASLHSQPTASIYDEWYPLHAGPSLLAFEVQHAIAAERWRYNEICQRRAHAQHDVILGDQSGLYDLFAPAGKSADGAAVTLVVGPFATARPTSGGLLAQWRRITGGLGRLSDPAFSQFVTLRLAIPTLDPPGVDMLKRLLRCFSNLAEGKTEAFVASEELRKIRPRLGQVRAVERVWAGARSMIDARTARGWTDADRTQELLRLGVKHLPDLLLVCLLRPRTEFRDKLEEYLARDALQRVFTEYALRRGHLVCAPIANYAMAFLVEESSSAIARTKHGARRTGMARGGIPDRLSELAAALTPLARRFSFALHFGAAARGTATSPARAYALALAAAEEALSRGAHILEGDPNRAINARPLGPSRRELSRIAREEPARLVEAFQGYFQATTLHHGFRLEPVRAELAAGFDSIIEALEPSGVMDRRGLGELESGIQTELSEVETVNDIHDIYRRAVANLERTLRSPTEARRERGFRRALAYLRENVGEDLSRRKVARIAGFGEQYFSRRFSESEGTTFKEYVTRLRLERSKNMLLSTTLTIERVGHLCGFPTRAQFHKTFRRAFGLTPRTFRESHR
jgi:AraC-like DNA-binding protein